MRGWILSRESNRWMESRDPAAIDAAMTNLMTLLSRIADALENFEADDQVRAKTIERFNQVVRMWDDNLQLLSAFEEAREARKIADSLKWPLADAVPESSSED